MKISLLINEQHFSTCEVVGRGYLGAHIYLNDHYGSGKPKMDIFLSGYDTNNPKETKSLKWRNAILEKGDVIKIEMMPDAPADNPSEIKSLVTDKRKKIRTIEVGV